MTILLFIWDHAALILALALYLAGLIGYTVESIISYRAEPVMRWRFKPILLAWPAVAVYGAWVDRAVIWRVLTR